VAPLGLQRPGFSAPITTLPEIEEQCYHTGAYFVDPECCVFEHPSINLIAHVNMAAVTSGVNLMRSSLVQCQTKATLYRVTAITPHTITTNATHAELLLRGTLG